MTIQAGGVANNIRDDPLKFGVGARVTIAVMADNYVEIILGVLKSVNSAGLSIDTSDVSTYIGGSEEAILRYVTDLTSTVATTGKHASVNVHLFRGCPGAIICESPGSIGPRVLPPPEIKQTGNYATAEWALYPLVDQSPGADEPDHMRDILAAIDVAVKNGTFRKSERSVTRLEGDLGTILGTVVAGWIQVGRSVQHVASHLTISLNSPSHTPA